MMDKTKRDFRKHTRKHGEVIRRLKAWFDEREIPARVNYHPDENDSSRDTNLISAILFDREFSERFINAFSNGFINQTNVTTTPEYWMEALQKLQA